ncbi:MAG TPA: hypothetical protein ACFE0H_15770 [Elainellaceae cyanobacterium]
MDEPYPLLRRVFEHGSAAVAFDEYRSLLRRARWLLRHYPDLMLLAVPRLCQPRPDELEDSRIRSQSALERLYLVAAIALLYATTIGMAVQLEGLRQQVDPHWRRGLSYLKIGLR